MAWGLNSTVSACPKPIVAAGKAARGHYLGPHDLLQARRSWEQAPTPGRCDLLSEAKGEPRREEEGSTSTRQLEALAKLPESWGKMGPTPGKQRGDLTPWRRAWLDLRSFLLLPRCIFMEAASQKVPSRPAGGHWSSPPHLCRPTLVAPAPLDQNQAHWTHHRPWHLLSVPASQAGFRFQKYVARLLSVEFNDGQPLRVQARGAGRALAGTGLCGCSRPSSRPGAGCAPLAQPMQLLSRPPSLLQNPAQNLPTWARPSLPSFPLHLHLEPGGMAILDQPMYHLCPQHGNVKKQTVWSRETPPGPPGPKEWQQVYV